MFVSPRYLHPVERRQSAAHVPLHDHPRRRHQGNASFVCRANPSLFRRLSTFPCRVSSSNWCRGLLLFMVWQVGGRALFRQSRLGTKRRRRSVSIQASSSSSPDSSQPIAPLHMESPVGQFLSQILTTHPHLLPAAVEQQLEKLQTDRDAEQQEDKPSSSGTDLVLYRFAPSIIAQAKTILFDSK